jgi:hypothetical protein
MNKLISRSIICVHILLVIAACFLVSLRLYNDQHPAPTYALQSSEQRIATFALTPEAQSAHPGDAVILNLTLDSSGQPFSTAAAHLTYPSSLLTFQGLDDSGTTCNVATPQLDGMQTLYCVSSTGLVNQQILHLATLHFTATGIGTAMTQIATDSFVQTAANRPSLIVHSTPSWIVITPSL